MSVKAETALILSDFGGFHKMIMIKSSRKNAKNKALQWSSALFLSLKFLSLLNF